MNKKPSHETKKLRPKSDEATLRNTTNSNKPVPDNGGYRQRLCAEAVYGFHIGPVTPGRFLGAATQE